MSKRKPAERLDLESSLLYHFAVVSSRIGSRVHAICSGQFGMSAQAWRVMAHVAELQPISAKEIGRRAAMDSVTLSRALSQLERLGYLERTIDVDDRRRIIVRLSRAGQRVYDKIAPISVEAENALLSGLSAKEQSTLRTLARRVWEDSSRIAGAEEE